MDKKTLLLVLAFLQGCEYARLQKAQVEIQAGVEVTEGENTEYRALPLVKGQIGPITIGYNSLNIVKGKVSGEPDENTVFGKHFAEVGHENFPYASPAILFFTNKNGYNEQLKTKFGVKSSYPHTVVSDFLDHKVSGFFAVTGHDEAANFTGIIGTNIGPVNVTGIQNIEIPYGEDRSYANELQIKVSIPYTPLDVFSRGRVTQFDMDTFTNTVGVSIDTNKVWTPPQPKTNNYEKFNVFTQPMPHHYQHKKR